MQLINRNIFISNYSNYFLFPFKQWKPSVLISFEGYPESTIKSQRKHSASPDGTSFEILDTSQELVEQISTQHQELGDLVRY